MAEVTYPVAMQDVINGRNEALVSQLFVPRNKGKVFTKQGEIVVEDPSDETDTLSINAENRHESYILSLKEGFGFIKYPPNNVFFHYTSLRDYDFNDLVVGDRVQFTLDEKEGGRAVAYDVVVLESIKAVGSL